MPIVEERRIYQSSKSSFAITLPRGWVRYFGLKTGDKVEVEANGELIVRPIKRAETRCPKGDVNKMKES